MGRIQDLPILERPREKATRYGIETLSDQELLSVVIGSGYHGGNAHEIAGKLLSSSNGLLGLSNRSYSSLLAEKGIKETRALLISAIFEIHKRINAKELEAFPQVSTEYLYNKYHRELLGVDQEVLIIVLLDYRKRIIYETTLYKGTENNVIFSYKDIWRELYRRNAKSFYLIHNHPSHSHAPSVQDVVFTQEMFRESRRIGIPLVDHIIIGQDGFYSFQKN